MPFLCFLRLTPLFLITFFSLFLWELASSGGIQRAVRLEESDPLTTLLYQITGPAHIPWQDPRWQELLHGYDVWVHVEHVVPPLQQQQQQQHLPLHLIPPTNARATVMDKACQSLVLHAPHSSNLAALLLHITRLLNGLDVQPAPPSQQHRQQPYTGRDGIMSFATRMALAGKARATAGALNLGRILMHAVLANARQPPKQFTLEEYWTSCFQYNSRRRAGGTTGGGGMGGSDEPPQEDVRPALLHSLLDFVVRVPTELVTQVPELYDTLVLVLQLLIVSLSSQLYQPMTSSHQRDCGNYPNLFWSLLMENARLRMAPSSIMSSSWDAPMLLRVLLQWQIDRPVAPSRSIQYHAQQLAWQVVSAQGVKKGNDGLFETHRVVLAASIQREQEHVSSKEIIKPIEPVKGKARVLLDATKGVLVLSSTIILLPFRLVSLALGLLGRERGYDEAHKKQLESSLGEKQCPRTNDILWLTDSPVADLSASILLLLLNNQRAGHNPFRIIASSLVDNRWDDNTSKDLPDLPSSVSDQEGAPLLATIPLVAGTNGTAPSVDALAINFEGLFAAFGATTQTELGALLLYTIMQVAPNFVEACAVRSDLDTLVMPLLRTMYFSSSSRLYDFTGQSSKKGAKLSIRNCPFRSQAHLYVMIILLLLFSQDTSFGADAFRRVIISSVPWYRERHLKSISLGSIILLAILRLLNFNLSRLSDPFLLSNCCAILMNLSSSIVELHDYAAMRLVAVTTACMKRYTELVRDNPGQDDDEDLTNPTSMHGEVARTLLHVIKQAINAKNVDRNLHLIYALVYYQSDLQRAVTGKDCPFRKSEYSRIVKVVDAAAQTIAKGGEVRTAARALKLLLEHVEELRKVVSEQRSKRDDDYTYTYEEEADPEIFFVPYVWEVIVCAVTSTGIEWHKDRIQVFPLLDDDEPQMATPIEESTADPTKFSSDVVDVV